MSALNVCLDDVIKQKKVEKQRNKRIDSDGDVDMGSSRGPTRGKQRNRNNNRSRNSGPYSRRSSFHSSGDASKSWTHDLYGKDDDDTEETGWGSRGRRDEKDLLSGTVVTIDNLHWEVTEEELKNVFQEKAGSVTKGKIFYDASGRSKGHGEVTFDKYSDAKTALTLHGKKMKGKTIEVAFKPIRERNERSTGRDDRRRNRRRSPRSRSRSPSPSEISISFRRR